MLDLYHAGTTACSKKARLCLKEKKLPYNSHYVSLRTFQNLEPDYLAINPNGLVPTLIHDGVAIIESVVIMEYADEVFPENPLTPKDAVGRARMRVWFKIADDALAANMTMTSAGKTAQTASKFDDRTLADIIARTPLVDRKDRMQRSARNGYSQKDLAEARERAIIVIDRIETDLGERAFLVGHDYSLADIAMIPFIDNFKKRGLGDIINDEKRPRTNAWYERIMARPHVIATFCESDETRDPRAKTAPAVWSEPARAASA